MLLRIGTPLTMDEFAWTRTEAVFYNSLFYGGLAVIAIISFVFAFILTKWFAEELPTLLMALLSRVTCLQGQ